MKHGMILPRLNATDNQVQAYACMNGYGAFSMAQDQTLFALPILPGKTEAARSFIQELEGTRKGQYVQSEERLGLTKEVWAIQQTPQGDMFVVYIAGENIGAAFQRFAASQDEFDQWFKGQVLETTGADLNTPPSGPMSEILSDYAA